MTRSVPTTTSSTGATAAGRITLTGWLVCAIASIGFAFDIYELLMLPLVIKPAIQELSKGEVQALVAGGIVLWMGITREGRFTPLVEADRRTHQRRDSHYGDCATIGTHTPVHRRWRGCCRWKSVTTSPPRHTLRAPVAALPIFPSANTVGRIWRYLPSERSGRTHPSKYLADIFPKWNLRFPKDPAVAVLNTHEAFDR